MRERGTTTRRGAIVLCTSCGAELGGESATRECECRRPRSHLVEVVMLAACDAADAGRDMRSSLRIAARAMRSMTTRGAA